jgi:hypothetical protein
LMLLSDVAEGGTVCSSLFSSVSFLVISIISLTGVLIVTSEEFSDGSSICIFFVWIYVSRYYSAVVYFVLPLLLVSGFGDVPYF